MENANNVSLVITAENSKRTVPSAGTGAKKTVSNLGLHPIVTFQYSSINLYQVSYHIR